jgi:hypothetical protein
MMANDDINKDITNQKYIVLTMICLYFLSLIFGFFEVLMPDILISGSGDWFQRSASLAIGAIIWAEVAVTRINTHLARINLDGIPIVNPSSEEKKWMIAMKFALPYLGFMATFFWGFGDLMFKLGHFKFPF